MIIDIETRADLSVTDVGLYRHAPTADILCMWYKLDGSDELVEWRGAFADGEDWRSSDAPPKDLIDAITAGEMIYAHNAAYERVVMSAQSWLPDIPVTQTACTAAWAAAFNLPRALNDVSRRWLDEQKQSVSHLKYMWNKAAPLVSAKDMDEQSEYCRQDVVTTENLLRVLPPMDPDFLRDYHVNEYINDYGAFIDRDLAKAIVKLGPAIEVDLLKELNNATNGAVEKLRGPSFLNWLKDEVGEEALTIQEKYRVGYGFKTKTRVSANKKARAQLMEADPPPPPQVVKAIHAFEEANKAAVRKFKAAMDRTSDDGHLRGQFVLNGASQTGRFSSHGVQVHNLKRDVADEAEEVIRDITGKPYQVLMNQYNGSLNTVFGEVLRPLFVSGSHTRLIWGDWSSVEARMLPWLTGYDSAERVLDVFRRGEDIYVEQAKLILQKPDISKWERQAYGKVPVLALGYQGGVGAFQSMAAGYGVEISNEDADEIKKAWRNANPWAPRFWQALEEAALYAMHNPGHPAKAGRITYQYVEELLRGTLLAWLPSGRWLAYPDAKIDTVEKFGEDVEAVVFEHPEYGPSALYGGLMAENVTQAECATLLRRALRRCEEEQLDVVLHVHDEIVIESENWLRDKQTLASVMQEVPEWAPDLPVAADVEMGSRYKISA